VHFVTLVPPSKFFYAKAGDIRYNIPSAILLSLLRQAKISIQNISQNGR
jgi:hypothetical protein